MNIFALSAIAVSVVSMGFGVSVYLSNRSSRMGRLWLIFMVAVSLWGLGLYGVTSAPSAQSALMWQYLLDASSIFIPITYLHFVFDFLNSKRSRVLTAGWYGAFTLLFLSFTPFFKTGVSMSRFGFYWIDYGSLYILFPLYFVLIAGYATVLLVKAYHRHRHDKLMRGRIRNHLIASAIGFGGGITNFFPQLFNVYPYGNYFVALYVVFMVYAVLRYRFFNIRIVSAQFFALAIVLFAFFNLFDTASLDVWLLRFGYFVLTSVFGFLLVRSVYREVEQREKLEKLAKELKDTNHRQETIIHFIGHEVKGFLTKDIGTLSMVADGDFGTLTSEGRKFVQEALAAAREGVRSVTGILQAANLKKGTVIYHMRSLDIEPLVKESVSHAQEAAHKKGLTLNMRIDPAAAPYCVKGDAEQLQEHVFRNVIDNAIAYTPHGSVTISLGKNEKGNIVCSIRDTGVGISEEDKRVLFTEGGHGKDSLRVNAHSTGYGLYIVKEIVEAHKGRVYAESDGPGKGSTFIIEFPSE